MLQLSNLFITYYFFIHLFVLQISSILSIQVDHQICNKFSECKCDEDLSYIYVTCVFENSSLSTPYSTSSSINQYFLQETSTSNSKQIDSLVIQGANKMPDELLSGLYINMLFLNDSNLTNLRWQPFRHVRRINEVYLERNRLNKIDFSRFEPNFVQTIETLNLENNLLLLIPRFDVTGSHFDNLNFLILNSNVIERFSTFDGLSSLKSLYLMENLIEVVNFTSIYFKVRQTLVELKLDSNWIESISPLGYFPRLETLSIARNYLRTLEPSTFTGLYRLSKLDLSSNKIEHLPANLFETLKNLCQLNLSNNRLEFLPSGLFKDLKQLRHLELNSNR